MLLATSKNGVYVPYLWERYYGGWMFECKQSPDKKGAYSPQNNKKEFLQALLQVDHPPTCLCRIWVFLQTRCKGCTLKWPLGPTPPVSAGFDLAASMAYDILQLTQNCRNVGAGFEPAPIGTEARTLTTRPWLRSVKLTKFRLFSPLGGDRRVSIW